MARTPLYRLTAEQERQVRELLAKSAPAIQKAFEAAIKDAHAALDYNALIEAIRANDQNRIYDLLRLNQAILWPVEESIRTAILAGGLSVKVPQLPSGAFGFNGRHPRAERIIAQMGADLVTETGSPGAEAIRAVLMEGQEKGTGAAKVARALAGSVNRLTGIREGGILGLDAPRAQRSVRVRQILSDPDQIAEYFNGKNPRYGRTDRRYDAMVRKAIAEGRALSDADVDKIAKMHDARLLKDRAKMIAENEAFTAQAQGRNEAYRQLLDRADVESVNKKWQHASAKEPRIDHLRINGETVGFDQPFPAMDDGAVLYFPHDPRGGVQHSVNCRCSVVYIPQFRMPGR